MDAPTVRTGGWWVLLSVFCGLPACTPPPKRAAIPTPVWFEPTPEPVIEFHQQDWQTLADATEHGTNEAARIVNRMAESVLMLLGYADDIEAAVVARAAA